MNYQRIIGLYLMFSSIVEIAFALYDNFSPVRFSQDFSAVIHYLTFPVSLISLVLGEGLRLLTGPFNYIDTATTVVAALVIGAIGSMLYYRDEKTT